MISEHASPLAAIGSIDSGGQNVYVLHVARCLAAAGHRVDVFTRRDAPELQTVVDVAEGLRVVHVDAGPARFVPKEDLLPHMRQFAGFCLQYLRGGAACGEVRPDVLHANFFMSGWVGLRLREALGIPLVTTFHALGLVRLMHQKSADGFPNQRIDIERDLVRHSERLIAECPQDQSDLVGLYAADPKRISMVPCGFDECEFRPVPREAARADLGVDPDEFMVLQLGRMVPRKGIETVVRALAEPAAAGMRLHVVGGDCEAANATRTPEIGRLQRIARDCGVEPRVTFQGRRARSELHRWYAAADVFVTTPWYEPFGITPLEAMACARPVVGSAVGGICHTVVDGETGLLVPPRNPAALAKALACLRDDPVRAAAMGRAGRQRAEREFRWEQVTAQLVAAFREAIRDASASRDDAVPCDASPYVAADACRATAEPCLLRIMETRTRPNPTTPIRQRARSNLRPAIFIDKDGTLVKDVPYNVDPAQLRFTPHAIDALRLWREAGWRIVIVSNQSGLARGMFDRRALSLLQRALTRELARRGVPVDGFFACPHLDDGCDCRKPRPGMLTAAAQALDIDLLHSWMVGDILDDVEAGHRAGCRSILLDVGHETLWRDGPLRRPEHRVADLVEAARATLDEQDAGASADQFARHRREVVVSWGITS